MRAAAITVQVGPAVSRSAIGGARAAMVRRWGVSLASALVLLVAFAALSGIQPIAAAALAFGCDSGPCPELLLLAQETTITVTVTDTVTETSNTTITVTETSATTITVPAVTTLTTTVTNTDIITTTLTTTVTEDCGEAHNAGSREFGRLIDTPAAQQDCTATITQTATQTATTTTTVTQPATTVTETVTVTTTSTVTTSGAGGNEAHSDNQGSGAAQGDQGSDPPRVECLDEAGRVVAVVEVVSGEPVEVTCEREVGIGDVQPALLAMLVLGAPDKQPGAPPIGTTGGLHEVLVTQIQIQPTSTPNYVNLTLHYTDAQVAGIPESNLRVLYFDDVFGVWVELPAVVSPHTNSITVYNLDVSAFTDRLHRVGIFA